MTNTQKTLADFVGTEWAGKGELWKDPLGDEAEVSEVTLTVTTEGLTYTWSFEGALQQGGFALTPEGARFTDTWHHSEGPMVCTLVPGSRALLDVQGSYGPANEWGWRSTVSFREPTGELVLQMTNIAPWGEEARAVRMVGAKRS